MASCHPDKKHCAHGLCPMCYKAAARAARGAKPRGMWTRNVHKPICHPDRTHVAKGLCSQCYSAAYAAAHKDERRAMAELYQATHKKQIAARHAAYRAAHREEKKAYNIAHRNERRAYKNAASAAYHARNKLAALNAYGGPKCACCDESLIEGLTIDHINGGGRDHRKEAGGGSRFYCWLKKHNYPAGFQVLCGTCNMAKGTSDHCPHQDMIP